MSTTQLPAYDPAATCPKCGGDDVRTVYVGSHGSWTSPPCGLFGPDRYAEHLDRICQRCHFVWPEAPITREVR
jgi:hypothetical protein